MRNYNLKRDSKHKNTEGAMYMIKTELKYNPYLLETSVKFSGKEPKINSRVEEYTSSKLQDWILHLPDIFHDEMNGWNFEVDFSGTKMDFDELQEAFEKSGAKGSFSLFHNSELEGPKQKKQRIEQLYLWLEENKSRKFDYQVFKENNGTLLNDVYALIIVQGNLEFSNENNAAIENVNDVNEMEHVSLEDTPIVFFVGSDNHSFLKTNLKQIIQRNDVSSNQLFFYLDTSVSLGKTQRIISEMGVANPQIISESPKEIGYRIEKYFKTYPMTAYIQKVIGLFSKIQFDIDSILKIETEENVSINSETRLEINSLDVVINKLKMAQEKINHRENLHPPIVFKEKVKEFEMNITKWNKNKINVARQKSLDFSDALEKYFNEFLIQIEAEFNEISCQIHKNFSEMYNSADYGDGYVGKEINSFDKSGFRMPSIVEELLEFKVEKMIPENNIFDMAVSLFSSTKPEETKEKLVIEYPTEKWRNYALQTITPIVDDVLKKTTDSLLKFYESLAEEYLEHLKVQIEKQTEIKNEISSQLSDDERLFQADIDWFDKFKEKVHELERA